MVEGAKKAANEGVKKNLNECAELLSGDHFRKQMAERLTVDVSDFNDETTQVGQYLTQLQLDDAGDLADERFVSDLIISLKECARLVEDSLALASLLPHSSRPFSHGGRCSAEMCMYGRK
ncbi:unnamed protein product [Bodo saltans]|uniref:Uncharacterized protein n=1 Tax=Bodo saltans TaxID=75058 RepID=A0A0S4J9C5_BODSA|nr:unnamed protein product [Bodo saltans]|eukprot:CUG86961.1 unnamed protein product [Bodo saltans]